MRLELLGLQIDSPLVHPGAQNFRPPKWPPPPDWSPILDANGKPQCLYSDSIWPLDVWAGKPLKLNFGDGKTRGFKLHKANADLLRTCTAWWMFGPRGCRTPGTLKSKHSLIKTVLATCSGAGIFAGDLTRFPRVIDEVAKSLRKSKFEFTLTLLHEMYEARKELGFTILDRDGIVRLARLAPKHEIKQTPYISPRIWAYQLKRLRECLDEYLQRKDQVEACFNFCVDAYMINYGSLEAAIMSSSDGSRAPFQTRTNRRRGCVYHGSFKATADRFGVTPQIERWVSPFTEEKGEKQIILLSRYLDAVSRAGLIYLINFSLMRAEEAWNLRADCLPEPEVDEKFGTFWILHGETTKTISDSDARWVVSESAQVAVAAMTHIANIRMRCASARDDLDISESDQKTPYLISRQYEPWSPGKGKGVVYSVRPQIQNMQQIVESFPLLFDAKEITITEDDLRIARLIEPTLNPDQFKVGAPWKFRWHQLRRTGAVNMLSSDLVDEPSLQYTLKHHSRTMTLYYGRNHSRLLLNEETRTMFLKTMYQEIGRAMLKLQQPQYVSPMGSDRKDEIVKFISEAEATKLEKLARQGKVGARPIRAGFCVKTKPCPYGGIEAIAHCLGGDDGKGCPDLLIDTTKVAEIRLYEAAIDSQLAVVHEDSPRYKSLQAEKRAIGNYNDTVTRNVR